MIKILAIIGIIAIVVAIAKFIFCIIIRDLFHRKMIKGESLVTISNFYDSNENGFTLIPTISVRKDSRSIRIIVHWLHLYYEKRYYLPADDIIFEVYDALYMVHEDK